MWQVKKEECSRRRKEDMVEQDVTKIGREKGSGTRRWRLEKTRLLPTMSSSAILR